MNKSFKLNVVLICMITLLRSKVMRTGKVLLSSKIKYFLILPNQLAVFCKKNFQSWVFFNPTFINCCELRVDAMANYKFLGHFFH